MTLIACAMTEDYAVMVGDRRLISTDGRITEDNRNKLVLCESNLVFGYSGLAYLAGMRTDRWLVDLLSKRSGDRLDSKLEYTAKAVRAALSSPACLPPEERFLAILGVGFAKPDGEDRLRPFFSLISNYHQENWKPRAQATVSIRHLRRGLPAQQGLDHEWVGQQMPADQEQMLKRQMRRLAERCRLNGRNMIPILAEAIREVARHNRAVGRNLLAVAIPRRSVVPGKFLLTAGTGRDDHATFLYLPDGSVEGTHYAPAATASGVQIVEACYGPAARDGRIHL